MHLAPYLRLPGKGSRQRLKSAAKSILRQRVGEGARIFRNQRLQCVRKHIKAAIRHQSGRQPRQQIRVQDRQLRAQAAVDQRMLNIIVGQNGEIRHL